MRKPIAALLSLSLAATALAGCGQSPTGVPDTRAAVEATASASKDATLAKDFANLLKSQGYKHVTRRGTRVTLKTDGVATTYNFDSTAVSGLVRVESGDFGTWLSHKKLVETIQAGPADILPAALVPIAIQVALGGAIKLAHYAITHRGENFKKDEAVKAMVEGMLAAAIPIVRDVKYAQYLVPLALAILKASKSLDYKDIAKAATEMIDDIVRVLWQMIQAAKAAVHAQE